MKAISKASTASSDCFDLLHKLRYTSAGNRYPFFSAIKSISFAALAYAEMRGRCDCHIEYGSERYLGGREKYFWLARPRRASLSTACLQQVVSPVRTWTWLAPCHAESLLTTELNKDSPSLSARFCVIKETSLLQVYTQRALGDLILSSFAKT
jgi:hypothetical protein